MQICPCPDLCVQKHFQHPSPYSICFASYTSLLHLKRAPKNDQSVVEGKQYRPSGVIIIEFLPVGVSPSSAFV